MPRILLLLLFLLVLPACSISIQVGKSPQLKHIVVAWLKDHGNPAQRRQLLDAGEKLKAIPGLKSLSVGECLPSPRPIVDSTYDVAFIMTFCDAAAMQKYLAHPLHEQAAREVLKPLTKKIAVYDFVEP